MTTPSVDPRVAKGLVACPNQRNHTPSPPGYTQWFEWAERKGKTHTQERCPRCGLYVIWTPKKLPTQDTRSDQEESP